MATPGNPRGGTLQYISPGNNEGRRRAIGGVAALQSSPSRPRCSCDAGTPEADQKAGTPGHRPLQTSPSSRRVPRSLGYAIPAGARLKVGRAPRRRRQTRRPELQVAGTVTKPGKTWPRVVNDPPTVPVACLAPLHLRSFDEFCVHLRDLRAVCDGATVYPRPSVSFVVCDGCPPVPQPFLVSKPAATKSQPDVRSTSVAARAARSLTKPSTQVGP